MQNYLKALNITAIILLSSSLIASFITGDLTMGRFIFDALLIVGNVWGLTL